MTELRSTRRVTPPACTSEDLPHLLDGAEPRAVQHPSEDDEPAPAAASAADVVARIVACCESLRASLQATEQTIEREERANEAALHSALRRPCCAVVVRRAHPSRKQTRSIPGT